MKDARSCVRRLPLGHPEREQLLMLASGPIRGGGIMSGIHAKARMLSGRM